MSDNDVEPLSCQADCITPPLSPTKTISTEGWQSPRTPITPRKARSCLFIHEIDDTTARHFLTPLSSPTKSKPSSLFVHLGVHEHDSTTGILDLTVPLEDLSLGPCLPHYDERAPTHARTTKFPTLGQSGGSIHEPNSSTDSIDSSGQVDRLSSSQRDRQHSFSASSATGSDMISSPTPVSTSIIGNEIVTPTKSPRQHLRCFSSPLRSSQWAARGGLLPSPHRSQTCSADRFISCRRPPALTRDSFELGKPTERRQMEQITCCNSSRNRDPFSRRLRRSGRLNYELRGLREAHFVIIGRSNAHRRNATLSYRRNSYALGSRQVSAGAVWNVGGVSAVSDTVIGVSTGRGGMLGSGTNAPLYKSAFLNRGDPEAELEAYERRLALAFGVDQTERILQHFPTTTGNSNGKLGVATSHARHTWQDCVWTRDEAISLLDAPQLRDDYYCTLLAYSHTAKCLAVGLGNYVHLWSEASGVNTPEPLNTVSGEAISEAHHVTSLDFSSTQGGQSILAVGRADGRILLWSSFDTEPRFDAVQPKPISCVSWRPTTKQRPSLRDRELVVATEELLVGDELGHIYFYSVEWPSAMQNALFGWHGAMTLLARMTVHTQQICGLVWAPDGELFASGGNDNNCFLFESRKLLRGDGNSVNASATVSVREGPEGESVYTMTNRSSPVHQLLHTAARHKWTLNAAVKAMAFCPWQRGLIAIGGGSNDRCIHFYHTRSGTCLATIDCAAQVTSLLWSQTRREIAATFGFAQPEHPYRIGVFAWPSCEQIVAVPWWDENRALCAVTYPGGPTSGPHTADRDNGTIRSEDGMWPRRGDEDGCIVIATSDMAIRFHEIWGERRGSANVLDRSGTAGLLGGSDILEGLSAIERDGPVIR